MASNLIPLNPSEYLSVRGLTEETCKFWKYMSNQDQHVATYWKDGVPVAQKVRKAYKGFHVNGDFTDAGLYGDHLWAPHPKKGIIICEGEIDAMTVSQLQNNEWPVVSVPNGAGGAVNAIKKNLEYLEGFKHVIFMFDMDEPGKEAAQACAEVITIGKAKIASLPLKDPNEMLKANRGAEVIKAMWDAKPWSPGGLLAGGAISEKLKELRTLTPKRVVSYPWPLMTQRARYGLWTGELVMLGAAPGVGKSTFCKELIAHLVNEGERVLIMSMEEDLEECMQGLLITRQNRAIYDLPPEEIAKVIEESPEDVAYFEDRVVIHDHWGSMETDEVLKKMRYAVKSLGCSYIFLDHISILISGRAGTDERKDIDYAMTAFRSFVNETRCGMLIVSHLSWGDKKRQAHDEGGKVSARDFRGSASLHQLSDVMIALERDVQAEEGSDVTEVRVLKKRKGGMAGVITKLEYSPETGRLKELGVFA